MPTFDALIDWTEQGVKNFRETVDRYEASRDSFEQLGVRLTQVYWTLGEHDLVAIAEADDEETMAAANPDAGLPRQRAHYHDARLEYGRDAGGDRQDRLIRRQHLDHEVRDHVDGPA